jgi:hypothetical protein
MVPGSCDILVIAYVPSMSYVVPQGSFWTLKISLRSPSSKI